MVKNITKIATVTLLATLVGSASAHMNFGFSFGCPRPVYYTPAPVLYTPPSIGFGFSDSNFGFGINIPLESPRRVVRQVKVVQPVQVVRQVQVVNPIVLDQDGKDYWRIHNNTDVAITAIAIDSAGNKGDKVVIMPGYSRTLERENSFRIKIIADDGQRARIKTSRHNVMVNLDDFDEIYCSAR